MFYAIGNIFSGKPRQAEQSDTRQEIQRHDPDYERRRQKKEKAKLEDPVESGATIAVEALRIFLENFIRSNSEPNEEQATKTNEQNPDPLDFKIQTEMTLDENKEEPEQTSGFAAQAASAYAHNAHAQDKSQILLETTDQADGPSLDLSAADLRTIHSLIDDLKELQKKQVEYLHIERAETFLQSLVAAVEKAKNYSFKE